jgi:5S rRNA maturation endonuclease (ribonuclease M5)
VVLSLDAKTGPINAAYKQGGMVVFLTDFDKSGKSLSDFIKAACP